MADFRLASDDVGVNRNFWQIAVATGISGLGDQIALFARIWASLEFGRHGFYVAPTVLAYSGPMVVLMLLGGAVGGRRPLRVLIIFGGLLAALSVLLGGILPMTPAALIGVSFLVGVLDSVRAPTGQSVIALAVSPPHLYEANRIRQVQFQVTRLAGPVAAGGLISLIGVQHTFLVSAGLYLLGGAGLIRARLAMPMSAGRAIDWSAISRAWGLIRSRPQTLWMMIFYGFSNFAWLGPIQVGVPRLVRLLFHAGPAMLGVVNGSFGVGLLSGTLMMGRVGGRAGGIRYVFLFVAASDIGLGTAGLMAGSWGMAAVFFGAGLLFAPVGPLFNTYIQERTPADTMTAVLSFTTMPFQWVQPVSVLVSGLFSAFDPRVLFVAAGVVATAADLVGFFWINRLLDRA